MEEKGCFEICQKAKGPDPALVEAGGEPSSESRLGWQSASPDPGGCAGVSGVTPCAGCRERKVRSGRLKPIAVENLPPTSQGQVVSSAVVVVMA